MRVVAPDLPGRGRSELARRTPRTTARPVYIAAMAALIARLDVTQVDWVGTSLGGHIGMVLAAQPESPIRRLVLNDFGARVSAAALRRIGGYLRKRAAFRDARRGRSAPARDLRAVRPADATPSGATWPSTALVQDNGGLRFHYDPAIVQQFCARCASTSCCGSCGSRSSARC